MMGGTLVEPGKRTRRRVLAIAPRDRELCLCLLLQIGGDRGELLKRGFQIFRDLAMKKDGFLRRARPHCPPRP
jgi:hypothetical protein